MLNTHIKRKYFQCFLSFVNFCLFLVMQIFYGFSDFANFLWVSCKVMKAVDRNDTSYLSWGSSPKLASGSLWLVGVETCPAAVCPPLLLSLQLQLLHGSGLHFMKSGGALVAKTIVIDRQHSPTARLCSPRAIRSRKERRLVS